jgi:hypothetical protein
MQLSCIPTILPLVRKSYSVKKLRAFRLIKLKGFNHGNDGCFGFSPNFPAKRLSPFGSFEGSRFFFCCDFIIRQIEKMSISFHNFSRHPPQKNHFFDFFVEIADSHIFARENLKPVENSVETV